MRFVRVCLFQLGTFVFHATRVSTKASSSTLSYLIQGRSYHYTMCVRVCMCVCERLPSDSSYLPSPPLPLRLTMHLPYAHILCDHSVADSEKAFV